MTEQELKIRCLELATQSNIYESRIKEAGAYYDFITGTNDAEILRAARTLSGVVNAKQ